MENELHGVQELGRFQIGDGETGRECPGWEKKVVERFCSCDEVGERLIQWWNLWNVFSEGGDCRWDHYLLCLDHKTRIDRKTKEIQALLLLLLEEAKLNPSGYCRCNHSSIDDTVVDWIWWFPCNIQKIMKNETLKERKNWFCGEDVVPVGEWLRRQEIHVRSINCHGGCLRLLFVCVCDIENEGENKKDMKESMQ